jgi:hypothetical protein
MATNEDTKREAERYRRAAEETLDQLDRARAWCVDYLYRIGKPEIAKAIANNRRMIRRRMRGDD